jgi:Spy/CpxP family protein refolding chaperone
MLKTRRKEVISMKKTIIIGLSLALVLALLATVALALGPGFGRGFGPGAGSFNPSIPDLAAEQSAQIQTLREAFLKDIEPLQKDLKTKRTELRNHWSDPKTDPAAITAKQKEIWDLQSKLQEKAANLRLEVRKVLTPEQLAQLPAFSQGAGFAPGAGFGPRGFGSPMSVRGPMGRW